MKFKLVAMYLMPFCLTARGINKEHLEFWNEFRKFIRKVLKWYQKKSRKNT